VNLLFDGPEQAGATLILAHGAGAPMDSPFMDTIAGHLAEAGIRVARFEFPYMQRRRTEGKKGGPDRQPVLLDTYTSVIESLRETSPKLFIGGKSLGGRMASMIAEEAEVTGLICLGYPFHPPGRPEKLRTEHLKTLATPTLILQGTRDPFGRAEEVPGYELSESIRVVWLEDGDHGLKPRKKSGFTEEEHLQRAAEHCIAFMNGE